MIRMLKLLTSAYQPVRYVCTYIYSLKLAILIMQITFHGVMGVFILACMYAMTEFNDTPMHVFLLYTYIA